MWSLITLGSILCPRQGSGRGLFCLLSDVCKKKTRSKDIVQIHSLNAYRISCAQLVKKSKVYSKQWMKILCQNMYMYSHAPRIYAMLEGAKLHQITFSVLFIISGTLSGTDYKKITRSKPRHQPPIAFCSLRSTSVLYKHLHCSNMKQSLCMNNNCDNKDGDVWWR